MRSLKGLRKRSAREPVIGSRIGAALSDERVLDELAEQVQAARAALLARAQTDPEKWWTAAELRDLVANGWPSTTVMIALNRLIADHLFDLDPRLRVRVRTHENATA
jgi:hypothetical protein